MTESQMPETPWWSQPAPTTVLEQPSAEHGSAEHGASEQAFAGQPGGPPKGTRRAGRSRALLLALALVAAGGTGGAVVAAVDSAGGTNTTTAVSSTGPGGISGIARATGGGSSAAPVGGSPESAAAVIAASVVTIEVTGTSSSGNGFGGAQQVSDTGSGVVLRADGYVLTNNHVIAAALNGGTVNVTLPNGKTVPATIVGHDTTDDLAVLKLAGAGPLTAATFSDSSTLRVGQPVLAVGAPLGLSNTVTQGIVSTLHRPVATGEPGASAQSVIDAIQTDAAINPGNSGGALVDLAGHVVGINSAIATTGSSSVGGSQSGNIGVGFAIPANDAVKVADQLIKTGHATHAQMGISVTDAASTTNGAPGLGASIGKVAPGGPAEAAGLQPGDLVVAVGDRRVTDANSLIVAIRSNDPGSTVKVTFTRGGTTKTASVVLGSAASD